MTTDKSQIPQPSFRTYCASRISEGTLLLDSGTRSLHKARFERSIEFRTRPRTSTCFVLTLWRPSHLWQLGSGLAQDVILEEAACEPCSTSESRSAAHLSKIAKAQQHGGSSSGGKLSDSSPSTSLEHLQHTAAYRTVSYFCTSPSYSSSRSSLNQS